MAANNSGPLSARVSDEISYISGISWARKYEEILIVGEEGLVVMRPTGEIISISPHSFDIKLVAQQRTPQGWQFLSQRNLQLKICTIPYDGSADVLLEDAIEKPHTASWSTCGQYIAVGSIGNVLSVWKTDTGELCWRESIKWDGDDELLTSPTLSVDGWSQEDKYIVTTCNYLASVVVMVWDAEKGEVCTIID